MEFDDQPAVAKKIQIRRRDDEQPPLALVREPRPRLARHVELLRPNEAVLWSGPFRRGWQESLMQSQGRADHARDTSRRERVSDMRLRPADRGSPRGLRIDTAQTAQLPRILVADSARRGLQVPDFIG